MRKTLSYSLRIAMLSTTFLMGSCGVTDLQLRDFVSSTATQVVSQGVTDLLGSFILAEQDTLLAD